MKAKCKTCAYRIVHPYSYTCNQYDANWSEHGPIKAEEKPITANRKGRAERILSIYPRFNKNNTIPDHKYPVVDYSDAIAAMEEYASKLTVEPMTAEAALKLGDDYADIWRDQSPDISDETLAQMAISYTRGYIAARQDFASKPTIAEREVGD